jgi:hypothetical protein
LQPDSGAAQRRRQHFQSGLAEKLAKERKQWEGSILHGNHSTLRLLIDVALEAGVNKESRIAAPVNNLFIKFG